MSNKSDTPPSSSKADLNAALAAASKDPHEPYSLDGNECTLAVPLPPGVIAGLDELVVTIQLTGDIVSFISPLASMGQSELPAPVATALLRRQFFPSQTEGANFAIADREDVLVAQYHWMPTAITADEFSETFGRFVSSALRLRDELKHMSSQGAPLTVLDSST